MPAWSRVRRVRKGKQDTEGRPFPWGAELAGAKGMVAGVGRRSREAGIAFLLFKTGGQNSLREQGGASRRKEGALFEGELRVGSSAGGGGSLPAEQGQEVCGDRACGRK